MTEKTKEILENEKEWFSKTWKEKIIDAMDGHENKWFQHKTIFRMVKEKYPTSDFSSYTSITGYILDLVRTGHVVKAVKPAKYRNGYCNREWIYKRTDKKLEKYKRGESLKDHNPYMKTSNAELGFEIYKRNRNTPKWFRDMMLD